jgi:trans-2,3-dihydro-3-hydroxyanthranilate isomerase
MRVSFVTCDVFTDRPFAGNPLLVVPDATGLTTEEMQAIAREINYSESTFVLPPKDPRHAYLQRTFVPVKEIPYAGHPTVGTAVVMASLGRIGGENGAEVVPITIEVGFGPLRLELIKRDGVVSRVRMEQGKPSWGDEVTGEGPLGRLAAGLGIPYDALLAAASERGAPLRPRAVSTGNRMLIVPVDSVDTVSLADPDPRILRGCDEELDVLGTYVFAFAGGARIRARGFFPSAGVSEDPATGSAAGPLGIYLALHRALPSGAKRFYVDQGIEMRRPSELEVEALLDDRGAPSGVHVAGGAVVMMKGTLEV